MRDRSEIVIYQPDENLQLQVRLENETVWLNRRQLADLFGRDIKTIGKHINNALREELSAVTNFATVQNGVPVVAKFATTASDGKVYQMEYYSLDMILSVGYRVKSNKGILFRRWANTVLKNYLLNGYAFNQRFERLEHRVANVEERQNAFDIKVHDRFLIIDDDLYHFGASIKDLGKKLFAFTKLNLDKMVILEQVNK